MGTQIPVFYDAAGKVHRPMDVTDDLDPRLMPISGAAGNRLQNLSDGLYFGSRGTVTNPYVLYVNSAGADTTTNGSKAAPYKTLAYALSQIASLFPASQFNGYVTIALQAGQSFVMANDFNVFGGQLSITFYGDPLYGDFDTFVTGTTTLSQFMSDLSRPVLTFTPSLVNGLNYLAGFNRYGGSVVFKGLRLNLPAAPVTPSISLYTNNSDVVRAMNGSESGYVSLLGSIVNMTDINSYWGFLGVNARTANTTFEQFASQFWINGRALTASASPTTAELAQRQYFVKMYADFAGNNQQTVFLQSTSANATTASGVLNLTWADTTALVVTSGKTNQASFPIAFDINYGLRNYIFNLTHDQQSRALNVISSRLI